MITATLVPISFTFNSVTEKSRLRHGSLQVHHFPFSNLNFINHIDRSLGSFVKCKQPKLKILGAKDGCKGNRGIHIEQFDNVEYVVMLKDCARRKSVREGQQIHAQIVQNQEEANVILWTSLVNMYAKCGNLDDARHLFDKMPERNIVSWNAMLSAYIQNEYWEAALKLVGSMHDAAIKPDEFSCASLLGLCAGMRNPVQGKALHGMAIKAGFVPYEFVENALVDMYAKCILLIDAHQVFDTMPERSIVSCNAMLSPCIQNGYWEDALKIVSSMHDAAMMPNEFICSSLLGLCAGMRDPVQGKALHAMAIKAGFVSYEHVDIALVDMYVKCFLLIDAHQVFDKMSERSIALWNTMLSAFIQNEYWEAALKLVGSLHDADIKPTEFTCGSLIGMCAGMRNSEQGKALHGMAIKAGFVPNEFMENALVDMYTKCNLFIDAHQVFDKMPERSIVSWNAMLSAYIQSGHWEAALKLVGSMRDADIKPNEFICSSLLGVCAEMRNPLQGKTLHGMAIKAGFVPYNCVENALVDMYTKCSLFVDARQMFDKMPERSLVSWNAMLSAYIIIGYWETALSLVGSMHDAGIKPDEFTCSSLLEVCAGMRIPVQGKALHGLAIKAGFVPHKFMENALVDMYTKCNLLTDACRVDKKFQKAIKLISQMHWSSRRAKYISMSSVLKACAKSENLQTGKQMHAYIIKSLPDLDVWVENPLITMYCKCGDTKYAFQVFERMSKKDVVSWNAMMAGFILNGHCEQALNLFRQMQIEGIRPDEFTFSSVLRVYTSLAAFELGKQVHVCIIKGGYESNSFVQNAIGIMYAKLRRNSCNMFEKTPEQNILMNAPHQRNNAAE